jgi:hypothetical protein
MRKKNKMSKFDKLYESYRPIKSYDPPQLNLHGPHITQNVGKDIGYELNSDHVDEYKYTDNGGKVTNDFSRNLKVRQYIEQLGKLPDEDLRLISNFLGIPMMSSETPRKDILDNIVNMIGENPKTWEFALGEFLEKDGLNEGILSEGVIETKDKDVAAGLLELLPAKNATWWKDNLEDYDTIPNFEELKSLANKMEKSTYIEYNSEDDDGIEDGWKPKYKNVYRIGMRDWGGDMITIISSKDDIKLPKNIDLSFEKLSPKKIKSLPRELNDDDYDDDSDKYGGYSAEEFLKIFGPGGPEGLRMKR